MATVISDILLTVLHFEFNRKLLSQTLVNAKFSTKYFLLISLLTRTILCTGTLFFYVFCVNISTNWMHSIISQKINKPLQNDTIFQYTLDLYCDLLERLKHRSVLVILLNDDTLIHLILIRSVYANITELAIISSKLLNYRKQYLFYRSWRQQLKHSRLLR